MVLLGAINAGALLLTALSAPLAKLGLTNSSPIPIMANGKPLQGEPFRAYNEYLTLIDDVLEALPPSANASPDIIYNGSNLVGSICAHVDSLAGLWTTPIDLYLQSHHLESAKQMCDYLKDGLDKPFNEYRHVFEGQFEQDRKSMKSRLVNALNDYIKNMSTIGSNRSYTPDFYLLEHGYAAQQMSKFFKNGNLTIAKAMNVTQEHYRQVGTPIDILAGTLNSLQYNAGNLRKMKPPYIAEHDIEASDNHVKAISELAGGVDFQKLRKNLMVVGKSIHDFFGAAILAADRQDMLMQRLDYFFSSNAGRSYMQAETYDYEIKSMNKGLPGNNKDATWRLCSFIGMLLCFFIFATLCYRPREENLASPSTTERETVPKQ